MRYAVVQKELVIPPVDRLKRAFRHVQFLTELDAYTLAKDAFGMLVRNVELHDANQLQSALAAESITTEVVPEPEIPALPPAKLVHRLDCQPAHLLIYDPLGRPFPLEWGHVMMIAAGSVRLNDFNRIETRRTVIRFDAYGNPHPTSEIDYQTKEELNFHLVLEIILTRAVLRYSVAGDKFNFAYLDQRRTDSAADNFRLLVRDLTQFAPGAAINQGAYYLRENAAEIFCYPSRNAFFEEISWLLWRMRAAR